MPRASTIERTMTQMMARTNFLFCILFEWLGEEGTTVDR